MFFKVKSKTLRASSMKNSIFSKFQHKLQKNIHLNKINYLRITEKQIHSC